MAVNPLKCRQCGAPLDAFAPRGICPRCFLEANLLEEPTGTEQPSAVDSAQATGWEGPLTFSERQKDPIQFGPYELLEEIAHGGMGVVYRARQISLNRAVAIKMLLLGHFSSDSMKQRFRREATAAAKLQHPNIVAIHEVGEWEGQQYFSMDFVEGQSLADLVREKPLPASQAAGYAQAIANAIEYAHTHGVLHRDLKPSNILINVFDEVRITDFGLAKCLEDQEDLTLTGQVLGSPNYLAPELAAGGHRQATPSSDIYAIGAMLYELLTGRPPFLAASIQETLLKIRDNEPAALRLLNAGIPRDLETICHKCLEKEAEKRYPSAKALAQDLDRFLRGEPIQTRAVSGPEKVWRWCKRKPVLAGLASSVVVVFAAGFLGVLWQWSRAEQERKATQEASRQTQEANLQLAEALSQMELQRAQDLFDADEAIDALAYLARALRHNPANEVAAQRLLSALTHRNFALPRIKSLQHEAAVSFADFSPDGQRVVTAAHDGARVWDAHTGRPVTDLRQHPGPVTCARFSPDGSRVVTCSGSRARIWDATTGQPLTPWLDHAAAVSCAQFSPDGQWVVTASHDFTARVWDGGTGEPLGPSLQHAGAVQWAEFSPDGSRVITASSDKTTRVWDSQSGEALAIPLPHGSTVKCAGFSPDGQLVVTASFDKTAQVWNVHTGRPMTGALVHDDQVWFAEFSPNGERIVTASLDQTARIWDSRTGDAVTPPLRHNGPVWSARFSPDTLRVVTASQDRTARIWDANTGQPLMEPLRHNGAVRSAQMSADGQSVVTASLDGAAQVWDVRVGRALSQILRHKSAVGYAQFSPDGQQVATASADKTARVWNTATGQTVTAALPHAGAVSFVQFSPEGRRLVTASIDGTARIWSVETGQPIGVPLKQTGAVKCAQFSPDGRRIVTASADRTARVWNATTGEPLTELLPHDTEVIYAQFSADGRQVITDAQDQTTRVWDVETGRAMAEPRPRALAVTSAHFSPDGLQVVTDAQGRHATIFDARTGLLLIELGHHERLVSSARFSPDGRRVVTASWDHTARVWDARTGHLLAEPFKHDAPVLFAQFSPDSQRIVTAAQDGTVRIWEAPPATLPIPGWLPELAETLAGQRLTAEGKMEFIAPDETLRLKVRLPGSATVYGRWARWFLADRAARAISPNSAVSTAAYLEERIQENTMHSHSEAARLSPANEVLWASLADRIFQDSTATGFKGARGSSSGAFTDGWLLANAHLLEQLYQTSSEAIQKAGTETDLDRKARAKFLLFRSFLLKKMGRNQEAEQGLDLAKTEVLTVRLGDPDQECGLQHRSSQEGLTPDGLTAPAQVGAWECRAMSKKIPHAVYFFISPSTPGSNRPRSWTRL